MTENPTTDQNGEALESTTLARRSFDSIKADIISGQLAQGTKIVESDLALKYGISRGPLREAIHRLEQIKLIVRIPHAGSRVVTLDSKMMQDIYVAREALEGMAARLAARLMPRAEIKALSELLDQHAVNISETEGKAYFQREGDIDFHYRIALASQKIISSRSEDSGKPARVFSTVAIASRGSPSLTVSRARSNAASGSKSKSA